MARKINTQLIIEGKNKAGAAFKQAESQLSRLSASAKKAGAVIVGALSVTALSAWVKGSVEASDAAIKTARSVGFTVEELTALRHAAELGGVASSELTAGLSRLNRAIDEAANGGTTQAEAFDRVGVSVLDAAGNVKAGGTVLAEIADKFQSMPDGVQKSALAMELFGKSGAKLVSLLNGGSAGLESLRKEAEALGLVIGTDTALQAELFNDNLTRLGKVSAGAGNQVSADLLPSLLQLTDLMVEVNKEGAATNVVAGLLGGGMKILATVVLVAANAFGSLGRFIGASAAAAVSVAKGEFSQAVEIMRSVGAENAQAQGEMIKRVEDLWSGAGEAAAAAAVEQKKQQKIMTGDLKAATDEMAVQLKQQVKDAQSALKDRVKAERDAARQLETAKKAQLDTEKRYSEALAKLGAGAAGDPSYAQAQSLRLAASTALRAGDIEGAKASAQAALKVLADLQEAGENTYGFGGFINSLKAIEDQADQINVDKAKKGFDDAQQKAVDLKALLDSMKETVISVKMSDTALAQARRQIMELAALAGKPLVIGEQVANPGNKGPGLSSALGQGLNPPPQSQAATATSPANAQHPAVDVDLRPTGIRQDGKNSFTNLPPVDVDVRPTGIRQDGDSSFTNLPPVEVDIVPRGIRQDGENSFTNLPPVDVDLQVDQEAAAVAQQAVESLALQFRRQMQIPIVPIVQDGAAPADPTIPGYAGGGQLRGPGTGTSDDILLWGSNGEYMLRADAVRHYGKAYLDQLNARRIPKFAGGGFISSRLAPAVPQLGFALSQAAAAKADPVDGLKDWGRVTLESGGRQAEVLMRKQPFDELRRTAMKHGRTHKG